MGLAKVFALAIGLAVLLPQARALLLSFGFLLLGAVILAGIVAFGVFLIRRTERNPSRYGTTHFVEMEGTAPPECLKQEEEPRPADDVLQQLRAIDWFQFEKVVALAYRNLGYTVSRSGGANPDGGIDLVIERDGQRSAVQCKQWKTWNVGVKAVREFLGALTDAQISNGIFITLCGYTGEARRLAEKHGIEIVNEAGLAKMLQDTDARFDPEMLAVLRDTRKFCPKCEREMVLRTATKGAGAGRQFWGCSAYPKCRVTMQVG